MPGGLRSHSRATTPARLDRAVMRVVTATGRLRTSPRPRTAPGNTYLSPRTRSAGPPRSAATASIATAPATPAAPGPRHRGGTRPAERRGERDGDQAGDDRREPAPPAPRGHHLEAREPEAQS